MDDPHTPAVNFAMLQLLVHRSTWLALDTETTGLEDHDQVVDLAILDSCGNLLFESLACPTVPLHPEAAAKTGLTDAMLKRAPAWSEVWARATELLEGREIVAFNAVFDGGALARTCAAHGVPFGWNVRWTCAQKLLSPLWSSERVSLARVCRDLGIEPGTHRAASDARAMVSAMRALAAAPMVLRRRDAAG